MVIWLYCICFDTLLSESIISSNITLKVPRTLDAQLKNAMERSFTYKAVVNFFFYLFSIYHFFKNLKISIYLLWCHHGKKQFVFISLWLFFFTFQTNTNGEKTLSHHPVAKSVKHFNVILPISDCQIWSMDLLTTQLW